MKDAIDFLDRIEGHGYGGMADYEVARTTVRDAAAEIERLMAERDLWQARCFGALWLVPDEKTCGDLQEAARLAGLAKALLDSEQSRERAMHELADRANELGFGYEQRADLIGGPQPEATKRFRDAGA